MVQSKRIYCTVDVNPYLHWFFFVFFLNFLNQLCCFFHFLARLSAIKGRPRPSRCSGYNSFINKESKQDWWLCPLDSPFLFTCYDLLLWNRGNEQSSGPSTSAAPVSQCQHESWHQTGKEPFRNTAKSRNPGANWTRQCCTRKQFPEKIETFQQPTVTHVCLCPPAFVFTR